MFEIKVFPKANSVLGVLKGDFTLNELEEYITELKKIVREKLNENFSYIIDISEFYTSGLEGTDSVDKRMSKLRGELEDMGLDKNYILGAGMKTYVAVTREGDQEDYRSETLFCESLDEVIEKLSQ